MLNTNCHVFRLDPLLTIYLKVVLPDAIESMNLIKYKKFASQSCKYEYIAAELDALPTPSSLLSVLVVSIL